MIPENLVSEEYILKWIRRVWRHAILKGVSSEIDEYLLLARQRGTECVPLESHRIAKEG